MQAALNGIRVIDCGRYISGPFCGSLLAECGADVIRVEPISGAPDRYVTPVAEDGSGAFYLQVNRYKRSIALDFSTPAGKKILEKLIKSADVVIANMTLPELKKLRLDHQSVSAINNRIILVTTSAFGNTGKYKNHVGFDGIAQAMSGLMHLTGPSGHPSKAMYPFVDFMTGLTNAFGVVVALAQREKTQAGQWITTSLMKSALTVAGATLAEQSALKPDRQSTWNRSQIAAPYDTFRTKDGWVFVQVIGNKMFDRWTKLVQREDLVSDDRFRSDLSRGNHSPYLSAIMSAWTEEKNTETVLQLLSDHKIPAGPVYSPQQVIDDVGFHEAGLFIPNTYDGTPTDSLLVAPLFDKQPNIATRAPKLGEHTVNILVELGYNEQDIEKLLTESSVFQMTESQPTDCCANMDTSSVNN